MVTEVEVLSFIKSDRFEFDASNLAAVEDYVENVEPKCVCFTGSRPNSLPWKYNESCDLLAEFKAKLRALIVKLYDMNYRRFISGMALGFDMIACEVILELKSQGYDIFLECAVACENQEYSWPESQKKKYYGIIQRANKVTYVSREYSLACFKLRNQYMVDRSSVVIAAHFGASRGTANTIAYAQKLGRKIIYIS